MKELFQADIISPADLPAAAKQIHAITVDQRMRDTDRASMLVATLNVDRGSLLLRRTDAGRLELLCDGACLAAGQSGSSRDDKSIIEELQAELEETNRGVLALYAELDDRADKLRKADELKSRFLSYASHELRTPLNGIVGLVRLLMSREEPRPSEEVKQLGFIHRAAEDMREMVNDLLDLAKVEAGKVSVQVSEFGLELVFGALRGIFRPLLQSEEVVLIFEDTSAVPAIFSDEAKVSQILRNFISNALKFTERGTVRVWAETQGDTVNISVSDTGIGIAPEHLAHIFEEFTQVDNAIQKRVRGTGLGLPLCRKLAELLNGRVTVESRLGEGSTFTLELPRQYTAGGVPVLNRTTKTAKRVRPVLLIVDDEEIDRYLLSQLVGASGNFEILQAEDGQAGLEAARVERPDLVFLDLNLPRIDGFTVLAELRSDPTTRSMPVVIVTSRKLSETEIERLRPFSQAIFIKEDLSGARRLAIDFSWPDVVRLA